MDLNPPVADRDGVIAVLAGVRAGAPVVPVAADAGVGRVPDAPATILGSWVGARVAKGSRL